MRKSYKRRKKDRQYTINERIQASPIRLIDGRGKQLGIVSKEEALKLAREEGVDLVLIVKQTDPPIVKLIDFKKFLYQEEKKAKEARKGTKKSSVKTIKLSLFIGDSDFKRLVGKAKEFIRDGHQVRVSLFLRGREIMKKKMAFELIEKFISQLDNVTTASPAKLKARVISAVVGKKK